MAGKLERRAYELMMIPSALLMLVIFVEAARVSRTTEKSVKVAPEMSASHISFCDIIGYKNGLKRNRKLFFLMGPGNIFTIALKVG
jgi:hypothetical protein